MRCSYLIRMGGYQSDSTSNSHQATRPLVGIVETRGVCDTYLNRLLYQNTVWPEHKLIVTSQNKSIIAPRSTVTSPHGILGIRRRETGATALGMDYKPFHSPLVQMGFISGLWKTRWKRIGFHTGHVNPRALQLTENPLQSYHPRPVFRQISQWLWEAIVIASNSPTTARLRLCNSLHWLTSCLRKQVYVRYWTQWFI